ncbi:DUF2633 family protein [Enterobacteriaceae bacterium BIT-l23]|uniref:DUF2633 family protein n=1 Tax=Jejubacter calystegiae TaxID=2579935 RepID=A0A4P8YQF3_9ENTR|nr:YfgG family protein [Jejubacter calystegiae]NUU68678.1 DUF2633 family protein [Enterobacteriaceae bacterium BIT-l23]QCT22356.1 DUF2633 family protein [Jejubacter calystegiae]
MTQFTGTRKRQRSNSRMIRIVLLISFILFFARFIYSSIGAWHHYQEKVSAQQTSLSTSQDRISRQ